MAMNLVEEFKKPANYGSFALGGAAYAGTILASSALNEATDLSGTYIGGATYIIIGMLAGKITAQAIDSYDELKWVCGGAAAMFVIGLSLHLGSAEDAPADKSVEQPSVKESMIERKAMPAAFTPAG